jgi:hypothetical protein
MALLSDPAAVNISPQSAHGDRHSESAYRGLTFIALKINLHRPIRAPEQRVQIGPQIIHT